MKYTAAAENFDSLTSIFNDSHSSLKWEPLFVSPVFMKTWWNVFGAENRLFLFSIRKGDEIIGIAPLMKKEAAVTFVGSTDVCDYFDFIIVPGQEREFYETLLEYLKQENITGLDLWSLRPDSTVLNYLSDMAVSRGWNVALTPNDVSSEMALPVTWDSYLNYLNTKQRHEVRRKLRRLEEAGVVSYHSVTTPSEVNRYYDIFLKMFSESRRDKAEFLTEKREIFFRSMANNLAGEGIFRLGILELNSVPAAMIMYFDYHNRIYLYNSGFDTEFTSLSIGLLSKVLSIKESIESGRELYDFLKGDEIYKPRLGGKEVKLTDCRITLR